jgi:hypothetical protein
MAPVLDRPALGGALSGDIPTHWPGLVRLFAHAEPCRPAVDMEVMLPRLPDVSAPRAGSQPVANFGECPGKEQLFNAFSLIGGHRIDGQSNVPPATRPCSCEMSASHQPCRALLRTPDPIADPEQRLYPGSGQVLIQGAALNWPAKTAREPILTKGVGRGRLVSALFYRAIVSPR